MSNKYREPAFPTHPVQSKMGQILISFGVTKLELLTAIVYAGHGGRVLPAACIQIAAEIIDGCEAYTTEQPTETNQDSKLIMLK